MGEPNARRRSKHFRIACATMAQVFAIVLLVVGGAGQVRAQQTDADFSAYCRANFPNSSYQRFSQNWGTEHACVQGGTRQGIDYGEVCLITTGSRNYEISGVRVLCEGRPEDAPPANANDLGSPDLARYCIDNFPNSSYEQRNEPGGVAHYCRRPGATTGFTLQPIDLFQACQIAFNTQKFRKDGVQVICTKPDDEVATKPQGAGGSNGGGGPAAKPFPLPDTKASPLPVPPPPFPIPTPFPSPSENNAPFTPPSTAQDDNTTQACQALGGEWRSGTIPMVDDILSQMQTTSASREAECVYAPDGWDEQCRVGVRVEQAGEAYMETITIWQCHVAVVSQQKNWQPEDVRAAREEGCVIQKILSDLQEKITQNAGTMPFFLHDMMMESARIADLCDKPVLRFVWEGDNGFEEIEGDLGYYGGPYFLEVDYEKEQKMDSFLATLEWDDAESGTTGRTEILVSRTPEDTTLYRSDGINIEPWTPIADGAGNIPSIQSVEPGPPDVRP